MMRLYENCLVSVQLMEETDNETLAGVGVDMAGFEGVMFVATVTEGEVDPLAMKAQQDTVSNFATAADLAGTSVSAAPAADAPGAAVLDVYQPTERYVRPVIVAADFSTAPITSVIAIQYGARVRPVTQTVTDEGHYAPSEGTA